MSSAWLKARCGSSDFHTSVRHHQLDWLCQHHHKGQTMLSGKVPGLTLSSDDDSPVSQWRHLNPWRPPEQPNDLPVLTPFLEDLFTELDVIVANLSAATWRDLRFGSIAAWRTQVDYYWRLATGPWVKTICEVGFNVGHSAAVWLLANPTLTVYTFDVFNHRMSMSALRYLQAKFPSRIVPFKGDSLQRVPREELPQCDVVHIDGRHSYEHVVQDLVNMQQHASPHALYIFDDQCNRSRCYHPGAVESVMFAGGPTLAVCDLVQSQLLQPVDTYYAGMRMWATFRAGTASAKPWVRGLRTFENGTLLPACIRPCEVHWASPELERRWYNPDRGLGARERRYQRETIARSCKRIR